MANSEIRVGKVSSVNVETGMARVTYRDKDESVTAEFPMLTNNDEYRMPEVGQDVLVAHLSNGSSRGAIIGTLWNQKYIPKESGKELYRKDFSRKKDAAYVRYSDETGEYLLKVAKLHLNGVDETILDGPKLEISANISILLQSEQIGMDLEKLLITGGESGTVDAAVKTDVKISQEENPLEALIQKILLELVESLEVKAGTSVKVEAAEMIEIASAENMKISGEGKVQLSAGGEMRLSDGRYDVTLTEIMERLEALGG